VRHVLANAAGRRIAIIVNEFGALGIDGDVLRSCGIPGCDDVVELANGCLCCTVADEFLPAMEALLDRAAPPEHIVIETSGLALPKPLLKAFGWPSIRNRVTVDGVIAAAQPWSHDDRHFTSCKSTRSACGWAATASCMKRPGGMPSSGKGRPARQVTQT
jgi:G3E family GTPase